MMMMMVMIVASCARSSPSPLHTKNAAAAAAAAKKAFSRDLGSLDDVAWCWSAGAGCSALALHATTALQTL